MDEGIADKEEENMEEARKELMEMMADESEPHFTKILWRLTNLGQLIYTNIYLS